MDDLAIARDPSRAFLGAQCKARPDLKIKTCWEACAKRYCAVTVWYNLVSEGEDVAAFPTPA